MTEGARIDDQSLVHRLLASYRTQLSWYTELEETARKALSIVVLSRGDLSGAMELLERKQGLLDRIVDERGRMEGLIEQWQRRKSQIGPSPARAELDDVLGRTEQAIRGFLDGEEQLKRYVQRAVSENEAES